MSSHHSVTSDSPRRPETQSTPRLQPPPALTVTATPTYPPLQSLTAPQATSSPRQYLSHHQPPTMPVEVLSHPALPHSMSGMPWQSSSGRSDERLPSVRSLIHLPPLEPPSHLPPPLATPLHHPAHSQPPPARHSWPLPNLAGPPPPPPPALVEPPRILTAGSPRTHHQTSVVDYARHASSRPVPQRPHSLTTISPVGYVTSPGGFSAHADSAVRLSPQGMGLRTPRRGSPMEVLVHNFTAPSSRATGELERRAGASGASMPGPASFQGTLLPSLPRPLPPSCCSSTFHPSTSQHSH